MYILGVFQVRIFPHLDWIFSANAEKYGPEKYESGQNGQYLRSSLFFKMIFCDVFLTYGKWSPNIFNASLVNFIHFVPHTDTFGTSRGPSLVTFH